MFAEFEKEDAGKKLIGTLINKEVTHAKLMGDSISYATVDNMGDLPFGTLMVAVKNWALLHKGVVLDSKNLLTRGVATMTLLDCNTPVGDIFQAAEGETIRDILTNEADIVANDKFGIYNEALAVILAALTLV